MEKKYEGYSDNGALWKQESIFWLSSNAEQRGRGGAGGRTPAQEEIPQYPLSCGMNLSWRPHGVWQRLALLARGSAYLIACMHEFRLLPQDHRGNAGVPVSHVNNEFLIEAPHEILISGILAHQGEIQNQIRGSWLSGWSAYQPI